MLGGKVSAFYAGWSESHFPAWVLYLRICALVGETKAKLVWVAGLKIDGNEAANALVRKGFMTPYIGQKPCSVASLNTILNLVKN